MRNLKYFFLFFALINLNAQKKSHIPVINDQPEKFDVVVFSKDLKKNRKDTIYINDRENSFIVNDKTGKNLVSYSRSHKGSSFSGYDYSLNPLFGVYKEFYPNNVLKTKGVYCWFGFELGTWYHYDENGKLLSTENTDEGWDFTYEKLFDYCKKNNIPLDRTSSELRTKIFKNPLSEEKLWGINYPALSKKNKDKSVEKIIHLNGENGNVESVFYQPLTRAGD